MSEQESRPPDDEAEAALDRILMDALRTESLNPQALERMRGAIEKEWQHSIALQRRFQERGRWGRASLLAAAVVLLAMTGIWFMQRAAPPTMFGSVSRLGIDGIDIRGAADRHGSVRVGDPVRAGDVLIVGGPALIAIAGGGTLRIAGRSAVDIVSSGEIRLEHGAIYVDKPALPAASSPLIVSTRAGIIEHVGTEFEVLSQNASVRIRVREGRIRLRGASSALGNVNVVYADAGTELLATAGGGIVQRPVATYGADWLWVAELAPRFEIEGQPLLEFLQWVTRETGRRLEFGDARARDTAARTILHGSIHEHTPLDALSNVLATTSLRYELRGDAIRVESGP